MPWAETVVFHMDEYVGVGPDHPAGFQRWIRERIVERAHPKAAYYVEGWATRRRSAGATPTCCGPHPLDLCCLGIGENGHLAFNDPPVADFADPLDVKVVELDEACRAPAGQRGHFPDLDAVPARAITVTIPALLRASQVLAIVPEARKARAGTAPRSTAPVSHQLPGHGAAHHRPRHHPPRSRTRPGSCPV